MENKSSFVNRIKANFVLILFICFIIFLLLRNNKNNNELQENGKQAKAYLYKVKGVGSKGTIRGFYRFEINNNYYEGFYDNENLKEHYSIDIIYLPDNPERNQAKQFVEDY
ncbi:hypothetical protein [Faecalibacter bovis]|uniref:DUF3592 domain-containing protein n=1 Tax=Faecalibacter bovis TaxID=2898187 RepID=A0ABX7XAE7_9FLAO|nr:hypothetical protein [Faecalibacter bovis]QTV04772.1 hypothetical protein J9309_08120 [Faecalibacter bovis]